MDLPFSPRETFRTLLRASPEENERFGHLVMDSLVSMDSVDPPEAFVGCWAMEQELLEMRFFQNERTSRGLGRKEAATPQREVRVEKFLRDREELRHLHNEEKKGHFVFRSTTKTSPPHKASRTPLSHLSPISLNDLRLEHVHRGHVLICRTIVPPARMVGVTTLIEDQTDSGAVEMLSLYNYLSPSVYRTFEDLEKALPVGSILAIKEPYFKVTLSGETSVRVDHPSDVVLLREDELEFDSFVSKASWRREEEESKAEEEDVDDREEKGPVRTQGEQRRQQKGQKKDKREQVEEWKKKGNAFFSSNKIEAALEAYQKGLELNPDHEVLHLNKAAALLLIRRFREAIRESLWVLDRDANNVKAQFRAGKGYYGIGEYEKAMEHFKKVIELNPEKYEAKREMAKIAQRKEERDKGVYDMVQLVQQVSAHPLNSVDCAEYIGPVEVFMTEGKTDRRDHGRGLRATRDISAGTLLLATRAVAIAYDKEQLTSGVAGSAYYEIELSGRRMSTVSQVAIVNSLSHAVPHDPVLAHQLSLLYTERIGEYGRNARLEHFRPGREEDADSATFNVRSIDRDRIARICSANQFSSLQDHASSGIVLESEGTGLWTLPSLINHSCLANTYYAIYGDMMFLVSTQKIRAREELTLPYLSPLDSYEERQVKLRKYGFNCSCLLCQLDEKEGPQARAKRKSLLEKLFDAKMRARAAARDFSTISALEVYVEVIQGTYQPQHTIPLELFGPLLTLGVLYDDSDRVLEALVVYKRCLRILGYDLDEESKQKKRTSRGGKRNKRRGSHQLTRPLPPVIFNGSSTVRLCVRGAIASLQIGDVQQAKRFLNVALNSAPFELPVSWFIKTFGPMFAVLFGLPLTLLLERD